MALFLHNPKESENMLKVELRFKSVEGDKTKTYTKTYRQDFISGYLFRKALQLGDKQNKYIQRMMETQQAESIEEQETLLDELFHFITEVFEGKFTAEEYERGTDARKIVDQSWDIVNGIIGQVMDPIGDGEDGGKKKKIPNRSRKSS